MFAVLVGHETTHKETIVLKCIMEVLKQFCLKSFQKYEIILGNMASIIYTLVWFERLCYVNYKMYIILDLASLSRSNCQNGRLIIYYYSVVSMQNSDSSDRPRWFQVCYSCTAICDVPFLIFRWETPRLWRLRKGVFHVQFSEHTPPDTQRRKTTSV